MSTESPQHVSNSTAVKQPFETLQAHVGKTWPHISEARRQAEDRLAHLQDIVTGLKIRPYTSVVAFGSLARLEWTTGSDLDWTLLVDASADLDDFRLIQEFGRRLAEAGYKKPGPTATFGQMASSHELIHHIGGQDDTNQNLTRRVLLLLESCTLSDPVDSGRVILNILKRYIVSDRSVSISGSPRARVPRFLLNDTVRLWRTFAVDYAWKKWERSDRGWALRNAKLRFSRKLTFVKGLLLAFDCELNPAFPGMPAEPTADVVAGLLATRCFELAQLSPIDVLSRVLVTTASVKTATTIMDAYDRFLAVLNDPQKRTHLDGSIEFSAALQDDVFREVREASHDFRDGLEALFFDDNAELARLTRRYGVF